MTVQHKGEDKGMKEKEWGNGFLRPADVFTVDWRLKDESNGCILI